MRLSGDALGHSIIFLIMPSTVISFVFPVLPARRRRWLLLAVLICLGSSFGSRGGSFRSDAVVLVNSSSAGYTNFIRYTQPYLDNFGVPYAVLDIATNAPSGLEHYALIIIGHNFIDTNLVFLNPAAQAGISLAVSNGTGLVNFDNSLATPANTPRYTFIQDIFGFGYAGTTNGVYISFPATEAGGRYHYITSLHPANDIVTCKTSVYFPSLVLPPDAAAISVCNGKPFVATRKVGGGLAVQFVTMDWMAISVKGPLAGMDDLIWRSFVWAARKPFVMRGMPRFITMRIDDVEGPFWWAHTAIDSGFRPWLGPFPSVMTEANATELRNLVTNGTATAFVHANNGSDFVYWNHAALTNWSDTEMSNRLYVAASWQTNHGIPFSKVMVPHYSECGPNAIPGLLALGVQYMTMKNYPGTQRNSPWMILGPYRLYEQQQLGSTNFPLFYADFLPVPGHPELNGQIFNCVTEIRDDASCSEWCPDNDVTGSIGRGTRQLKRAMDSMVLGTLFTHEWYIHPDATVTTTTPITTANWTSIIHGITNSMASYQPIYVTLDYACQYVRATRTARLADAQYDAASGQIVLGVKGSADLPLSVSVYVGHDSGITALQGSLPVFAQTYTNLPILKLAPAMISMQVLPSRAVALSVSGFSNLSYRVEASSNLLDWIGLADVVNSNGTIPLTDSTATNFSQRYYRALLLP